MISELAKLQLNPGGRLYATYYSYLPETKEHQTLVKDATEIAVSYLFEPIVLHPEITLGDVFKLAAANMDYFEPIFNNYIREYVEESLSAESKPPENIDYFEMFYEMSEGAGIWTDKKTIHRPYPQVLGHGILNGKKEKFAINCLEPGQYKNVRLTLKNETKIIWSEEDDDVKYKYDGAFYSLAYVIFGIFSEMSWHGGPKERDDFSKMLEERIEKSKTEKGRVFRFRDDGKCEEISESGEVIDNGTPF